MIHPNKLYKRYKPHIMNNQKLIISKNNIFYQLDENHNLKKLFTIKANFFDKIFFISKKLSRLFRIGVRASEIFNDLLFFAYKKRIYSYNFSTKKLYLEHIFNKGRGPLTFTKVIGIKSFEDSLIYGEYFGNPKKNDIRIYRRTSLGNWKSVYTFKNKTINHIHSIVPDKYRNCLWILAGDLNDSASIWQISENFKIIKKIVYGKQIYRSCVGFPREEGLLYATDTQFEKNSVRLLYKDKDEWKTKKCFDINGTSIYGCELKDFYVFSTATESNYAYDNMFKLLFNNIPGKGIIKNESQIIVYNKINKTFYNLYSLKKDIYPYGLMQLGNILFPKGLEDKNLLYAFSNGSVKYDQDTMYWKL